MSRERSQGAERSGLRHILEVREGGGGGGGGRGGEGEGEGEESRGRRRGGGREGEDNTAQMKVYIKLQKRLCMMVCL